MSFSIQVENFQSIASTSIVIDGFTAFMGPNNTGKSALVRALIGAFENTAGHAFVRHGTNTSKVSIVFSDGQTLVWEKGKKVNRFEVNGVCFDDVERGVPDEVAALGIRPILVGGKKLWPQLAPPLSPLFLLGRETSPSVVAEAVADVERVGKLNAALKLCDKSKRRLATTLKVRQVDLTSLDAELQRFEHLDELEKKAILCAQLEEKTNKTSRALRTLRDIQERYLLEKKRVTMLTPVNRMEVPAELLIDKLRSTASLLHRIRGMASDLERYRLQEQVFSSKRLPELPPVQLLHATESSAKLYTSLLSLQRKRTKAKRLQQHYSRLSSVVVGFTDQVVWARASKLSRAILRAKALRDQMQQERSNLRSAQIKIGEGVKDLQSLEEEFEEFFSSIGRCPTCGQLLESPK